MPCLIVNPRAGRGRTARWLQAQAAAVRGADAALRVEVCDDAATARAVVRALPPGQRVIVAGGDGTVHGLLPALVAGGHTLGLLPGGHGDDLARALGLRRLSLAAALRLALTGEARPIDLGAWTALAAGTDGGPGTAGGLVGGITGTDSSTSTSTASVLFASSLCCGLDAAIAQRAAQSPGPGAPSTGGGLLRYLRATMHEIRRMQPSHLQLRVDGRPVHDGEALFASVLNTPTYGSGMRAAPRAQPDDGQLDVLLAGRFGRWGALAMLPRLVLGRHIGHPRVKQLPGEVIELRAAGPMPLAADGEAMPPAAAWRVQVRPGALQVVFAPRRHG